MALIAIGTMAKPAIRASKILSSSGIEAEVVNARWIKTLDRELIADHDLQRPIKRMGVTRGGGAARFPGPVSRRIRTNR